MTKFWKQTDYKAGFEYARMVTAHYSKSFYISARMLPLERRWATFALYGFCRYTDNLIDNPRQRSTEDLMDEVHFMEREIKRAYRSGESEHPVLQPFIVAAKKYGIPREYPLELLKGVVMDINKNRYETFDELYLFAYRVAGVVGVMMTHVLGYTDDAAFEYAENLGVAMQLTNILRDVKEDKDMGRIYLPLEDLRRFGVSEQDIFDENMNTRMHKLMRYQIKRAHSYYDSAEHGIPMLERKAQFAIYASATIYRGILRKIEAAEMNPFLGRVFVSQMKKIGILIKELARTRLAPQPRLPLSQSVES